jgi:hypothetical protein
MKKKKGGTKPPPPPPKTRSRGKSKPPPPQPKHSPAKASKKKPPRRRSSVKKEFPSISTISEAGSKKSATLPPAVPVVAKAAAVPPPVPPPAKSSSVTKKAAAVPPPVPPAAHSSSGHAHPPIYTGAIRPLPPTKKPRRRSSVKKEFPASPPGSGLAKEKKVVSSSSPKPEKANAKPKPAPPPIPNLSKPKPKPPPIPAVTRPEKKVAKAKPVPPPIPAVRRTGEKATKAKPVPPPIPSSVPSPKNASTAAKQMTPPPLPKMPAVDLAMQDNAKEQMKIKMEETKSDAGPKADNKPKQPTVTTTPPPSLLPEFNKDEPMFDAPTAPLYNMPSSTARGGSGSYDTVGSLPIKFEMNNELKEAIADQMKLEREIREHEGRRRQQQLDKLEERYHESKTKQADAFTNQIEKERRAIARLSMEAKQNTPPKAGQGSPSTEVKVEEHHKKLLASATKGRRNVQLLEEAVSEELEGLRSQYEKQQRHLQAINATHEIQIQLLDRSILSVSGNINALLTQLQGDEKSLQIRNLDLEREVRVLHESIKEAEAWLDDALHDEDSGAKLVQDEKNMSIQSASKRLGELRSQRDTLLSNNGVLLKDMNGSVSQVKSRLESFLGVSLDAITTRLAQRSQFFEAGIKRLQVSWNSADGDLSRDQNRVKKLGNDFQQLKTALKVQEARHSDIMQNLEDKIAEQERLINSRKAQTKVQRKEALRRIKVEIHEEVEKEWKDRLAAVKAEAARKIDEEEARCKRKYDMIYEALSKRYTDEYNLILAKLELQKRDHATRQKTAASEMALLKQREERANSTIQKLEEKSLNRKNEESAKSDVYSAARSRVERLWRKFDTPVHERIAFLLRVDELLPYSNEAAKLYQSEINKLKVM